MRTMFGSTSCNLPSRFLEEIPKDLLDGYEEAFGLTETFSKAENKENNYTWTYGNSRANKTKIYNINDLKDKTVAVASNIMGKGAAFGRTAESFLSNLGKKNEAQTVDLSKYTNGVRVFHKKFGEGTITKTEPENNDLKVDINFDKVGHKRLMAKFANLEII